MSGPDVPAPPESLARVRAAEANLLRVRGQVGADARSAGLVAWWRDRPRRDRALSAVRAARAELDDATAGLAAERAARTERLIRTRARSRT